MRVHSWFESDISKFGGMIMSFEDENCMLWIRNILLSFSPDLATFDNLCLRLNKLFVSVWAVSLYILTDVFFSE